MTIGPIEIRNYLAANETLITCPHPSVRLESGERAYLHRDHLDSIQLVTDAQGAER